MNDQEPTCASSILVSVDRYCQERATQVLNDFAAVGTFLLNCEERVVSRWRGSQLNEWFDVSAFLVACRSNPAFSTVSPEAAERVRASQLQRMKRPYRCSQRTTLGDIPVIRRKCLAKWLWSENPDDRAISDTGRSVLRSICWAYSIRRCST